MVLFNNSQDIYFTVVR